MNEIKNLLIILFLLTSTLVLAQENRTYTGHGNNEASPELGSAESRLLRITTNAFADGISSPAAPDRGNPREISNLIFAQTDAIWDEKGHSDFLWAFGQFIDHDVSLVDNFAETINPEESMVILPPFNDPYFTSSDVIPMMRSLQAEGSGESLENPRQYNNAVSSFIDGSAIYGSDENRANWLRTFTGGKLKTSTGNLLPWNTKTGEFNSPIDATAPYMDAPINMSSKYYIAGDTRANENPILLSMHALFVREHNRLCDVIILENPNFSDEQIYQKARKLVGGIVQNIVYYEWLPAIGVSIADYNTYNPNINPSIYNVFSAAAFRMGHTLINSNLIRMKNDGETLTTGNISLRDAFFNPLTINLAGGIEPYIKGMATQVQQEFDCKVVDDLRNFLFGAPGQGGLDLAAININRGRDRGLPDYNTVRENFGLPRVSSFAEICSNIEVANLLQEIYASVDNVDPWVGMLAEDHMNGSIFGELVTRIIELQFRSLRDGDRFYFENDASLSDDDYNLIKSTHMVDVIMRNTNIELMQSNVFYAKDHDDINNQPVIEHTDLFTAVYPNPFVDYVHFKSWSTRDQTVNVKIYDQNGQIVQEQDFEMTEGKNAFNWQVDQNLPAGVYHMFTSNTTNFFVNKLLKI